LRRLHRASATPEERKCIEQRAGLPTHYLFNAIALGSND
jgi:hypothetical protein